MLFGKLWGALQVIEHMHACRTAVLLHASHACRYQVRRMYAVSPRLLWQKLSVLASVLDLL